MEKKRHSFEFKKKAAKRPLVSNENVLPIDIPPSKKHLVAKFANAMEVGTVHLATSRHVKTLMGTGVAKKVRPLGEVLNELPDNCSPQSLLVEVNSSQNDLSELMKEVASMKAQMKTTETQMKTMEAHMKTMEATLAKQKLINASQKLMNADLYEVSIRAFVDKVLEAFYKAAGKGNSDPRVQASWLRTEEAKSFCQDPKGKVVKAFGFQEKPNLKILKLMRRLREVSVAISISSAHSSSPIMVAYALEDVTGLKDSLVVRKLFQMCFNMSSTTMIKKNVSGEINPEHVKKFRLERVEKELLEG
ncbi:hypothetical protein M758_12G051400 [Ceratodon purpureus]|nr:hypothetical protein M758_12G051400 [Ceratodon purpureus]